MPEEARFMASVEADRRLTTVEVLLAEHVKQCDRRAIIAQKLLWVAVSTNLGVLGALVKMAFHL